ncbi:hypothetical protein ACFE04_006674 [Oxalis oulophora]
MASIIEDNEKSFSLAKKSWRRIFSVLKPRFRKPLCLGGPLPDPRQKHQAHYLCRNNNLYYQHECYVNQWQKAKQNTRLEWTDQTPLVNMEILNEGPKGKQSARLEWTDQKPLENMEILNEGAGCENMLLSDVDAKAQEFIDKVRETLRLERQISDEGCENMLLSDVDAKAQEFIDKVREKFRLERQISEENKAMVEAYVACKLELD